MSAQKPVLLLDIDGVCNLFGHFEPVTRPTMGARARLGEDRLAEDGVLYAPVYRLSIPTDLADLVDQLAEHFDLRWYTMWNQHAREVFAPTAGLRQDFEHLSCDWTAGRAILESQGYEEWEASMLWVPKTPLIPFYLDGRPFVWVDDDTTDRDRDYLAKQDHVGPHMLITVSPHEGMTQHHVDRAIAWAQSLDLMEELAS